MKFTKTQEKQIREFIEKMDKNCCVLSSDWTSGSGRFTKSRVSPPFVYRFERKFYPDNAKPQHNTLERTAYEFFRENSSRKVVLVLDLGALMNFLFDCAHGKEF